MEDMTGVRDVERRICQECGHMDKVYMGCTYKKEDRGDDFCQASEGCSLNMDMHGKILKLLPKYGHVWIFYL